MRTITEAPCRGRVNTSARSLDAMSEMLHIVRAGRRLLAKARVIPTAMSAAASPRIARSGCNGRRIWAYQLELAGRISTRISALTRSVAVAVQEAVVQPLARRRYALDAS